MLVLLWRRNATNSTGRYEKKRWYEAYNPACHARSGACARKSVWQVGCQQRLLVHVLVAQRRLSRAARGKQRVFPSKIAFAIGMSLLVLEYMKDVLAWKKELTAPAPQENAKQIGI
jgi:hypothetical protein